MKKQIKDLKYGDKIKINDNIFIFLKKDKNFLYFNFNNSILKIKKFNLIKILNISSIFTHNCQERLVCGQLGSIASRMALDDQQATTIDGTHKGAGIVRAQGIISHVQYYFEEQSWIKDWYKKRGLTEFGYELNEDPNFEIDSESIDLGEDEDITIDENKTIIEFNNIHKEIDHSADQKFEEI